MVKLQSLALLSLASTALAAPSWWEQWSLSKHSSSSLPSDSVVAWDADRRLVQTAADKAPFWTTEEDRLHMLRKSINYMDITNNQGLGEERVQSMRLNRTWPPFIQMSSHTQTYRPTC